MDFDLNDGFAIEKFDDQNLVMINFVIMTGTK